MARPKRKQPIRIPCLRFTQGKHALFILSCSARTLWQVVEVNRRIEDKEEGYQRALSKQRVRRLTRFFDEGNIVPLSILVAFDHAKYDADGKCIVVTNRPDAGWVIDGQHRLTGAHLASEDITLPVVALINLSLPEQIDCFVKINKEQKGVPSSLYYELLKQLPGQKTEAEMAQERAAEIADHLKTDENSPFFGKIVVTTAPGRGQLSLTNFVRKVAPYLRTGQRMMTLKVAPEDRGKLIDNYYKGLAQVFPKVFDSEESIFFKTLGFGALMNVFPDVLDATIGKHGGFTTANVADILKTIEDFDFEAWTKGGTGSKAEMDAARDLRESLQEAGGNGESGEALALE